jgi:hypothetical protein
MSTDQVRISFRNPLPSLVTSTLFNAVGGRIYKIASLTCHVLTDVCVVTFREDKRKERLYKLLKRSINRQKEMAEAECLVRSKSSSLTV